MYESHKDVPTFVKEYDNNLTSPVCVIAWHKSNKTIA